MANVCSFLMRIRGTKENCMKLYTDGMRQCYDWGTDHESGTPDDFILSVFGECRWSVTSSMIEDYDDDDFNGKTLAEKSRLLGLEVEVFGYDMSEPDWVEHFYYKNGECLKAFNLPPFFMEDAAEEFEEEELGKYNYIREQGVYVLKKEENEHFEWNEDKQEMKVDFIMPLNV